MPPNTPSKAHSFTTCKFANLNKKSCPHPCLPNPGYAHDINKMRKHYSFDKEKNNKQMPVDLLAYTLLQFIL